MRPINIPSILLCAALVHLGAWGESAEQGKQYLDALSDKATEQVTFEFKNEKERKDWSNLPGRMHKRNGLPFGDMTDSEKDATYTFLKAGLSPKGYAKATGVMLLDDILGERNPVIFNSDLYWMALFGTPDTKKLGAGN